MSPSCYAGSILSSVADLIYKDLHSAFLFTRMKVCQGEFTCINNSWQNSSSNTVK